MSTLLQPSYLAQRLELAVPAAFDNFAAKQISDRTRTALTVFGDLGRELGFMVCCRAGCYANRTDGEYL